LILGAVVGFACTAAIQIAGQRVVGAALLNMAVFGQDFSLVMLSYIKLKISRPELQRPIKKPLGIWALPWYCVNTQPFCCFSDPAYQPGIWGVAIFLIAAILTSCSTAENI